MRGCQSRQRGGSRRDIGILPIPGWTPAQGRRASGRRSAPHAHQPWNHADGARSAGGWPCLRDSLYCSTVRDASDSARGRLVLLRRGTDVAMYWHEPMYRIGLMHVLGTNATGLDATYSVSRRPPCGVRRFPGWVDCSPPGCRIESHGYRTPTPRAAHYLQERGMQSRRLSRRNCRPSL